MASELLLWGSGNLGVVLIEGAVSGHPHKGNRITRFVTYQSQNGSTMSRGRAAVLPRSTANRRQKGGSKPLLSIRWLGQRSLGFPAEWSF